MGGAHPHNLWIFFPRIFQAHCFSISQISGILLILFPLISLVATLVLLFGFALPFVLSGAVSFLTKTLLRLQWSLDLEKFF